MRRRLIILAVLAGAVAAALVPTAVLGGTAGTTLTVKMTGGVEVPKGAPAGGGTAAISVSVTSVCWTFIGLTGIDKPTAAHIHKAPAGKSGPVVVPFGAAFTPSGCVSTTAAITKSILSSPGSYYVNVHTAKFPGGAVRGQLGRNKSASSTKGSGY